MDKEKLKIILSAILGILVVSGIVYAFVFRNELSGKLSEVGKKTEPEKTETATVPASPMGQDTSAPEANKEKAPGSEKIIPENLDLMDHIPKQPMKDLKEAVPDKKKNGIANPLPEKKKESIVEDEADKKPTKSIRKTGERTKKISGSKKKRKHYIQRKSKFKKKKTNLETRVARIEKKLGIRKKKKETLEKRVKRLEKKLIEKK